MKKRVTRWQIVLDSRPCTRKKFESTFRISRANNNVVLRHCNCVATENFRFVYEQKSRRVRAPTNLTPFGVVADTAVRRACSTVTAGPCTRTADIAFNRQCAPRAVFRAIGRRSPFGRWPRCSRRRTRPSGSCGPTIGSGRRARFSAHRCRSTATGRWTKPCGRSSGGTASIDWRKRRRRSRYARTFGDGVTGECSENLNLKCVCGGGG